jgi:hypothetical protein
MPFLGLFLKILAWSAFVLAGLGIFFWAARWFPRQRWLAPTLGALFLFLGLVARTSKWAIPLMVLMLMVASGFIPRKRK